MKFILTPVSAHPELYLPFPLHAEDWRGRKAPKGEGANAGILIQKQKN